MEELIKQKIPGVVSEQHFVALALVGINPPAALIQQTADLMGTGWLRAPTEVKVMMVDNISKTMKELDPVTRKGLIEFAGLVAEGMAGPCDCGLCPLHPFWNANDQMGLVTPIPGGLIIVL